MTGDANRENRSVEAEASAHAVAAAMTMTVAAALEFAVDDAVVLNDSNRLVVRLLPCDVVARVSPVGRRFSARRKEQYEEVQRLIQAGTNKEAATGKVRT